MHLAASVSANLSTISGLSWNRTNPYYIPTNWGYYGILVTAIATDPSCWYESIKTIEKCFFFLFWMDILEI